VAAIRIRILLRQPRCDVLEIRLARAMENTLSSRPKTIQEWSSRSAFCASFRLSGSKPVSGWEIKFWRSNSGDGELLAFKSKLLADNSRIRSQVLLPESRI